MAHRSSVTIPVSSQSNTSNPRPKLDPKPLPGASAALEITGISDLYINDQRSFMQRILPSSLGGITPREIKIQPLNNVTPLPREPSIGNPYLRGGLINKDCLEAAFGQSTSQLVFGNLSHNKFNLKSTSQLVFGNLGHKKFNPNNLPHFNRQEMNMVIAYHMATAIDTETGIMTVIREGYIPGESFLSAKEAEETIAAGMTALARQGMLQRCPNAIGHMSMFPSSLRPLYSPPDTDHSPVSPPVFLDGQTVTLPDGVHLDVGQALDLLQWLSLDANFSSAWNSARATAPVLCILAVAKRGTISDQKLNLVLGTLPPALAVPIRAHICPQTIRDVYTLLRSRLNDDSISTWASRWIEFLPENQIAFRNLVQQMKYGGLISLRIVTRAIILYPDFDWHALAALFPNEWQNICTAMKDIGDNEFFGCRANLGSAANKNYRNLTWLGLQLFQTSGDEPTLQQYKGGIKSPLKQIELRGLIQKWDQSRRNRSDTAYQMDAESVQAVDQGILLAGAFQRVVNK